MLVGLSGYGFVGADLDSWWSVVVDCVVVQSGLVSLGLRCGAFDCGFCVGVFVGLAVGLAGFRV